MSVLRTAGTDDGGGAEATVEGEAAVTKIKTEVVRTPDGWSRWVYPVMTGYKLACCDCGLVHDVEFRVTDDYDRVEFRMRRNARSTAMVRRHRKP